MDHVVRTIDAKAVCDAKANLKAIGGGASIDADGFGDEYGIERLV